MKDEDMRLISDMVAEEKDVDDLNILKSIINERIANITTPNERQKLLLTTFRDFYCDNFKYEEQFRFKYRDFNKAIITIKGLKTDVIRLYNIIDIDKTKLLKFRGIGIGTISIVENRLKEVGLSLEDKLDEDEEEVLDYMVKKIS